MDVHRSGTKVASIIKDRKSTRLNSSHRCISYAVFCLKKKKNAITQASQLLPEKERSPPSIWKSYPFEQRCVQLALTSVTIACSTIVACGETLSVDGEM